MHAYVWRKGGIIWSFHDMQTKSQHQRSMESHSKQNPCIKILQSEGFYVDLENEDKIIVVVHIPKIVVGQGGDVEV